MSYYGDSMSYYYGGAFSNHSSLMTGVGRVHTPLRFAPHLSTISESPLSSYRRYSPMILPSRPKRIIDTADIDVSSPRNFPSHPSHPGNRLRRDRPTIRIRSQALKDNPALREHNARHEKTVGELLMEKFLIKDKKPESPPPKPRISPQIPDLAASSDSQEAVQSRVTRRMTRRRSSADVQMDPGQLERELAIAAVQAEVLDTLVAEEQAEIAVETRRGTLIHKNQIRSLLLAKSESEEEAADEKKKMPKKLKKRKKGSDKPSPPVDEKKGGKFFKIEASNSVGDLPTVLVTARDENAEFRESIKLQMPRGPLKHQKTSAEEEIVVVPIKKAYVHDNTRNSAYLTLKTQITKAGSDCDTISANQRSIFDDFGEGGDANVDAANFRAKDKDKGDTEVIKTDVIGGFQGIKEVESINLGSLRDEKVRGGSSDGKKVGDNQVNVIGENFLEEIEGLNCDFGSFEENKTSVDDNFWDFRASESEKGGKSEDKEEKRGKIGGKLRKSVDKVGEIKVFEKENSFKREKIEKKSTEIEKLGVNDIKKSVIAGKSGKKGENKKENLGKIGGKGASEGKIKESFEKIDAEKGKTKEIEALESENSAKSEIVEKKSTEIAKSSSTDSGISLISSLDPKKEIKSDKIEGEIKKSVISGKSAKKVEEKKENLEKIEGKSASGGKLRESFEKIEAEKEKVRKIKSFESENSSKIEISENKSKDTSKLLLNNSEISLKEIKSAEKIEAEEIKRPLIAEKSLEKGASEEKLEKSLKNLKSDEILPKIGAEKEKEKEIESLNSENSSKTEISENKSTDLVKLSSKDSRISSRKIKSADKIEAEEIKEPLISEKRQKDVISPPISPLEVKPKIFAEKSEDFPQKIENSEDFSQKIEKSEDFPQKIEKSEDFPQKIEKSEDFPEKIEKSKDFPQKIENFPQKIAKSKDFPQKIGKPEDLPQKIEKSEDFPQKIEKSEDFPRKIENSSEISLSKSKEIDSPQKIQEKTNKSPEKIKLSSIDSGIGSLEIDPKPSEKPKKKLKNTKGFSFDLSEEHPKLSEKEKPLPLKRLKKKLTSSKTLPLDLPESPESPQKSTIPSPPPEENSLLKIGIIPLKKSEPQLPPLKEDAKSDLEIDFWSEIPTAEAPKPEAPKLSLRPKTAENPPKPESPKTQETKIKNLKIKKIGKKPVKKIDKLISENLGSEKSRVKNSGNSESISRMKVLLAPATREKSADAADDGEDDSGPKTPILEISAPLINVEAPILAENEAENEESSDDESPKTPTNEESSGNLTKWDKTADLTNLDVNLGEIEAENGVAGVKSAKKKQSRRKKSGNGYSIDTIIRKLPTERSTGGANSDNDFLPSPYQTMPTRSPRNSPKVVTKRPNDLVKMFYTTPSSLLTATPRDLSKVKRNKVKKKKHSTRTPSASSDSTGSTRSSKSTVSSNSTEVEDETEQKRISSTRSNDSGFDGSPRLSNCDMACHKKCEKLTGNLCGLNQKLVAEALQELKRAPSQSSDNQRNSDSSDHVHGSGRITPPATNLPRFKKYTVEDFHFLKVLGKGSFGKVLLAELRGTDCVYAVKCLKKDVVLEDDDVECTLIERKVLTLATRHPYLCHLFCTFQTDSHLFFVMEYLNGGDLMFHIQKSGRFAEFRARFYAAEIWSGLNFLHKKGIVYRDLKLDNVLLDFEGHIRIADFGMCKLQIFLDRTADTFCGTPDYMAPEIIKGLKYNQAVDWWSFGVLLYEMLTGQSPFSGCDEDELFWSICNERPFIPRYLSQESMDMLISLLEKDSGKRPMGHEIQTHAFFHSLSWDRLERRQLEPPFKPALDHTLDTRYFDTAFTAERPRLTPVPEQILTSMDQGVFRGFSYTNPNATD